MTQKLRLDPTACTGHGLCADLLAERIELDEWGFPIILGDVPPGLAAHARRAVRTCPALALELLPPEDDSRHDPREERARHRGHDS
ncbi:MAG TPA: ferredoxin [Streptosporangiaceae bacterium]|nr:ferredoxin [Streptosporangiaceae bacterium]